MPNAKRDANWMPVMGGVASETVTVDGVDYVAGVTFVPFTVDSITERLRVKVVGNTGNNATPDRNVSRRDDNRHPVLSGEHNTDQSIQPLSIETANSGLMMKGN